MWVPYTISAPVAASLFALAVALRGNRRRWAPGVTAFVHELALVLALYSLWQFAGGIQVMEVDGALDRGWSVWDVERWLHLPDEAWLQAQALGHPLVVQAANLYYAVVHVPALVVFLLWLFLAHRRDYPPIRTALALLTGLCLAVQLVPVAPPRFLEGTGVVDTPAQYGQSVYDALGRGMAGQLAAMPSVHVGWAVVIAWGAWQVTRSWIRWVAVAHAVITCLVVVVTGNHFWLDGGVAVAILVAIVAVQRVWDRRRAPAAEPVMAVAVVEPEGDGPEPATATTASG